VAKNIGNTNNNHPSIKAISENFPEIDDRAFQFKPIDDTFINKYISKINVKKVTGLDGISPKLLHLAKPIIVTPLKNLVNMSLSTST
jgi:hypothetical protein